MEEIVTIQEVFDAIQNAKGEAATYCTNFYPTEEKLVSWISRKTLCSHLFHDASFFFQRDRGFWHLYYCARDSSALLAGMNDLPELLKECVVVDVVGKKEALADVLSVIQEAGFRPYKELLRMGRGRGGVIDGAYHEGAGVVFANQHDAAGVLRLLETAFDPYAKQIPSIHEIETAIAACQILVLHHEEEVAGVLFFETRGLASTLRFWAVAKKIRDAGVGAALIRHYLASQPDVKRFVLWVNSENSDALRKYRHYHYETDGVIDCVLANERITG